MAQSTAQAAGSAAIMAAMGLPTFGGGLTGGAGGAAGPATGTQIATITPAFDASNWTVSTGSSKASASNASGTAGAGLAAVTKNIPWTYVAIAAVVGVVLWKRL